MKMLLNRHKEIFLALVPFMALVALFGFLFIRSDYTFGQKQVIGENVNANQISSNYYNYSEENLSMASENGKAVLFFSTNWCSTCTELDRELRMESEKLDDDITVLKLDFDNSPELKNKYAVVVQHTLIQVDTLGNEITRWVGGDIETINKSVR